ncbi:ABC transporter sugar binding domain protein [Xanthomonas citri pv. mangiferaeindicae LMG 941]|nr:ABC transporter sugar binding domain protein [Xanthomonas citri pv. mangiferaeindicae LMG 941]
MRTLRSGQDHGAVLGDGQGGRSGRRAGGRFRKAEPHHPCGCAEHPNDRGARKTADRLCRRRPAGRVSARQHLAAGICAAGYAGADAAVRGALQDRRPGRLFPWRVGHQSGRRHAVRRAVVCGHAVAVLSQGPAARGRLQPDAQDLGRDGTGDGRDQAQGRPRPLRHPDAAQRIRAAIVVRAAAGRPPAARP